jgi:plasmid maintenance system antidote protein VapI
VTFREIIRDEFAARVRRDPRHSLRRFARFLGVHHSTLVRLLTRTGSLQETTMQRIAERLSLTAEAANAALQSEREAALMRAIQRRGFRPDSRWLAAISGLSIDRVNIALHALLHTGRLTMKNEKQWETR